MRVLRKRGTLHPWAQGTWVGRGQRPRRLFPPLDRAEGRRAHGQDVQEPRRRQSP